MKKFFTILFLVIASVFTSKAHQRIFPMFDITRNTYDEAIELIEKMEHIYRVDKLEDIKLNSDMLTTLHGEIILKRDGNSIKVTHGEFSTIIEKYLSEPNQSWYNLKSIRTELIIQNVKLFEYLYIMLSENRNIKSIEMEIESETGISYICINYYIL